MKNKHMLSTRYAIPVIILLTLALIPTTIHSYINTTVDDGKSVNNIAMTLNNFTSVPAKRNAQWGMDIFGSEDWFERDYQDKQYNKVRLFAARAYDHKRLYHHPELALSYGYSLNKKELLKLPDHPDMPVYVLYNKEHTILVAYALLYNGEFVQDPINHQLGESIRLLVNTRKPMTLLYVSQSGLRPGTQFEQSAATSLLTLAIQSFQSPTNIKTTEQ